jgi:drug/metabolite transporter (DMT)-like permease
MGQRAACGRASDPVFGEASVNQRRPWAAFLLLSAIWGSSFLFIKVAVEDLSPLLLVGSRLLFGLCILLPLVLLQTKRLPRDLRTWAGLLFVGVLGTAIPFTLISWGEQHVPSGLASILNATTPLFSILIADLWLRDTPVTPGKIGGLIGGFAGVIVLMWDSLGNNTHLGRQLAVVAAAVCYAVSNAFVRKRLHHLSPLVLAFGQLLSAGVVIWAAAILVERPPILSHQGLSGVFTGRSLFAVAWLGVLGSGVAYLLYFYLMLAWGATRSLLVTYLIPVVGVLLGATVLGEPLSWRLLAGGALIAGGIVLINWRGRAPAAKESPGKAPF